MKLLICGLALLLSVQVDCMFVGTFSGSVVKNISKLSSSAPSRALNAKSGKPVPLKECNKRSRLQREAHFVAPYAYLVYKQSQQAGDESSFEDCCEHIIKQGFPGRSQQDRAVIAALALQKIEKER